MNLRRGSNRHGSTQHESSTNKLILSQIKLPIANLSDYLEYASSVQIVGRLDIRLQTVS